MQAHAAARITEPWGDPDPAAALNVCEDQLARHLAAVVHVYGAAGLGVINLPNLGPEPLVAAQIRVAAVLYWCDQLERAGILPFVETLAEQVATGALPLPIGQAAGPLMRIWRSPQHRFTAAERVALFGRVFASSEAEPFDARLVPMARALSDLGRERRDRTIQHLQVRVGQLGQDIGRGLSDRAVGIAAFAARDIVAQIRQALAVLQEPELQQALGGTGPWMILARWGPRLLGHGLEVSRHVSRAESGMQILRWIADAAPDVPAAARRIDRNHALVHAAETWLGTLGGLA